MALRPGPSSKDLRHREGRRLEQRQEARMPSIIAQFGWMMGLSETTETIAIRSSGTCRRWALPDQDCGIGPIIRLRHTSQRTLRRSKRLCQSLVGQSPPHAPSHSRRSILLTWMRTDLGFVGVPSQDILSAAARGVGGERRIGAQRRKAMTGTATFRLRPLEPRDVDTVAHFEREIAKVSFPDDPITDLGFYAKKVTQWLNNKDSA